MRKNDRDPGAVPDRGIGFLAAGEADNAVIRGHLLFFVEMVKSGDEFARGEVATGAEDDDRARLSKFMRLSQSARYGFGRSVGHVHGRNNRRGELYFQQPNRSPKKGAADTEEAPVPCFGTPLLLSVLLYNVVAYTKKTSFLRRA